MPKLILSHLYKRYENARNREHQAEYAVNDFSLECKDGEFVGILGPSGCGKSSTLRMIAGLEGITAGEVIIGERVVNNVLPKDRHIGLAFEDYALYPPLSVYDNIAFNLRAKRIPETQIKSEIDRIAPLLKIEELLRSRPGGLSGGQKQRVNIARAIVREPQVLLLDEPLSHLDGKMRQVLRAEIKRLHKQIKCTTIIVTHDQLEAMSVADRIAIMKDGRLQQIGSPLEIYDDPANEFVASFIGEPPMNIINALITKEYNDLCFSFLNSDVKIGVPAKYYSVLKTGMQVKLGIRPTDLIVASNGSKGSEVRVSVFENFGEEKRISIKIGGGFLTLITPEEKKYKSGDSIRIEMLPDKTHVFDVATGDRIRAV